MDVKNFARKIVWLGHDGFRIDAGKILYFDPYQIEGGPTADVILITHEHYDHCSPEDVEKIRGDRTVIVTEAASAGKLTGDVRVMRPGEAADIGGIQIEAVPAYNTDKPFHPRKNDWLGFLVTIDGVRLYHAGDTDFIPEMKDFDADIALLPVSGTYVMTADEAVEAALTIQPKLAIPMHYGAIVGERSDAERFQNELDGRLDVMILKKG